MRLNRNRELWLAFAAILIITLLYLFTAALLGGIPAASDFFGHSLGILGFLLMLMTESLYSLRKRSRSARWGRMADWLQFHIFTGIVGPYLVLLHSSWKFHGLAGIVLLLTVIIVISGFIGRYIYTAVPRSADGVELEAAELQQHILRLEAELAHHPQSAAFAARLPSWLSLWRLPAVARQDAQHLRSLLQRRSRLRQQVANLARLRKALALWHTIHLPIGLALFSAAFIHIIAAFYYATLLR